MTSPLPFEATDTWHSAFSEATVGFLTVRQVTNPPTHPELETRLDEVESHLREMYEGMSRSTMRSTGHFPAYTKYYKRFGQNYHVLHQVESIALKGRSIPRRASLVEAAFKNELTNQLLTAIHDLDALSMPVTVDVATGDETYEAYNGEQMTLKPGDMFIRDGVTVLSSIILGPSSHARVTPSTTAALVYVYAPNGIGPEPVRAHLADIAADITLLSPAASAAEPVIISSGSE
jgi:DNA/RNA-binding domain of Phe-tRNA-synthetase-like protein